MSSRSSPPPILSKLPIVGRVFNKSPLVPVVRLSGVIGGVGPFRQGLSLSNQASVLERAFTNKRACAVALAVNSPGGSPVQSALIARRVRALAEEKGLPVFAFAEDVAASGGYWLVCAADEIYADSSSVIGSIGVVSGGFGFPELLKKIGVERRVYTSGESKASLDPFKPEKPADVKRLKALQSDIHEEFKEMVRQRRGERLNGDEKELFSGAFWTGKRALEFGLIDGLGDLRSVMRQKFGDDVRLDLVGERKGWLRQKLNMRAAQPLYHFLGEGHEGSGWASDVIAAAEERMHWARFGL